jgi:hypothetical protein
MKTNSEIEPVEIFAGTTWECEMVKSLLENEGLEVFLKDEIIGTLSPWWTAPGGVGSVKVIVSNVDFDKAKPIVDEYQKNLEKEA